MSLLPEALRVLDAWLPPGVHRGACCASNGTPALDGLPERADLTGMVPARAAEFIRGRIAARGALAPLGQGAAAMPRGPDRAPVWPDGITGSITHHDDLAIAVAARTREYAGLGLDLAPSRIPDEVAAEALGADDTCTGTDIGKAAALIFSAKETAYKAIFAQTRRVIGFDDMAVHADPASFIARLRRDCGPLPAGTTCSGLHTRLGPYFLTFAHIPATARP